MRRHLNRFRFKVHHIKRHLRSGQLTRWEKLKYLLAALILAAFTIGLIMFFVILATLPNVDDVRSLVASQSSLILDRNGETLYAIHGDENRKIIPYDQISPYASKAIMAIEDDSFYEHGGVDFKAFILAVCGEFRICNTSRGGSTITQQFVKNAFLNAERTWSRKAKEIFLSLQVESKYTKDEIMEMYLNRIPYGANIYGVEVASQTFFGHPAVELTIAESAILAAIPKATTHYSPYGNHVYVQVDMSEEEIVKRDIRSEEELVDYITKGLLGKTYTFGEGDEARDIYIKGRVDYVIARMLELGYINEEEAEEAILEANEMEFVPFREDIIAPHFVMHVRELLEQKYDKEKIEKGGFRITTTLDVEMQKFADEAVESRAEVNATAYNASSAALVSMDPNTGEILAMVGSADFWNDEIDGKVNVALRPRLPGSSFKPIVYAAAFLQGYAPSTVLYDVKTKFGEWYEPENFDGEFRGPVSMRDSLGASLNIPAVKAGHLAGIYNVLDLARKMGLGLNQPNDWYGLSLALGAGEARPLDMAIAYSAFANGGHKVEPVAILKIEDRDGNILEEYEAPKKRDLILDPQVAYLVNDVLSDPQARPTEYWRNQLTIPGHTNAAKTGTSNKKKDDENYPFDTWTIGYVRNLVTAVWAGNADGEHLSLKASGLDTAGYIWRNYMIPAAENVEKAEFDKPEGIKWVKVAARSGKLPSEYTPEEEIISAVFASFSTPTEYDDTYRFVEIDKVSGLLATEYTPEEALENKAYYTHHSALPENSQWEEAVRQWAEENGQDEEPPTEYDNVHTPDTMDVKPEITIKSPRSMSKVSPPELGVWVKISSTGGTSKVDYFFDDELVYTAEKSPFTGIIPLSNKLKNGSEHKIKAIVYDDLYRSNQSSVTVKIGKDETAPTVSFAYPNNKATVTVGTSIGVQADARDSNGSVERVRFYLDGQLKKEDTEAPFTWQLVVPSQPGNYELKAEAFDYADNRDSSTITIKAEADEGNLTGSTRVMSPSANNSFDEGEQILYKAFISEADRAQLAEVVFLAKKSAALPIEVEKITIGDEVASTYSVLWDSPAAGTYELYIKLILKDGKLRFTKKIPVIIR